MLPSFNILKKAFIHRIFNTMTIACRWTLDKLDGMELVFHNVWTLTPATDKAMRFPDVWRRDNLPLRRLLQSNGELLHLTMPRCSFINSILLSP